LAVVPQAASGLDGEERTRFETLAPSRLPGKLIRFGATVSLTLALYMGASVNSLVCRFQEHPPRPHFDIFVGNPSSTASSPSEAISRLEVRRMAGTGHSHNLMKHQQVIENFVREGQRGTGFSLKATEDMLYSRIPARPYQLAEQVPLAVRLNDDGLLVNGAGLSWPISRHQRQTLRAAEASKSRFGVVPYHSIVAAWTDGEEDDWNRAPIPTKDLQKEVSIVVPSQGERWMQVKVKDKHGREKTRTVHTLGDSVVRVKDRYYLSAVDETGVGAGMYFLAELLTDRAPQTLEDAFNALKPPAVREAEARGSNILRQGEWFAIPTMLRTSELMRDVEQGIAAYRLNHVLGNDGHHQLEEAVIYRVGDRKGQVFARGVLTHTKKEHTDLDLGAIRWYLIVHNVAGAAYTLTGKGTAQFD
jgi:hypothetical protein